MDLLKLLRKFVKVVLYISRPLPNKTKLKFDHDFNACCSFCFELKVLNWSKYSMPWARCAFGNFFFRFSLLGIYSKQRAERILLIVEIKKLYFPGNLESVA